MFRKIKDRHVFSFAVIGVIQYILFTTIGMFMYPGGTYLNPGSDRYIFTENFLSDLGRTVVHNGTPNTFSAILYATALTLVGITIMLSFSRYGSLFKKDNVNKYLGYTLTALGFFAGLSYIMVAAIPSNLNRPLHINFVFIAFLLLLMAVIVLMVGIYRSPKYPKRAGHALVFTVIVLAGYVALMFFGPDPRSTIQGLEIQVVGQKIIAYFMLSSLGLQAWMARRYLVRFGELEYEEEDDQNLIST